MKTRGFLFVALFFIMGVSSFADDFFWAEGAVGIRNKDTVEFYSSINGLWKHDPSSDFVLPAGYSHVFWAGRAVAIVQNNTLQFFVGDKNSWKHDPSSDLKL